MKLSEWAAQQGVHYQTVWCWRKRGTLPVPARQLASGTILVEVPASRAGTAGRTVVYAARNRALRALTAARRSP